MTVYEHYRRSILGNALTESLDEMVNSGAFSANIAFTVLLQFDKVRASVLTFSHLTGGSTFSASKRQLYRTPANSPFLASLSTQPSRIKFAPEFR